MVVLVAGALYDDHPFSGYEGWSYPGEIGVEAATTPVEEVLGYEEVCVP